MKPSVKKRPQRSTRWLVAMAALSRAFPLSRLHPAVVRLAAQSPAEEKWAIAFSGGADSLLLLLLVLAHWPARRQRICVLHFNHRLRGRAADGDERFCASVCKALGVRLVIGHWEEATSGASEATARVARHAFFAREMAKRNMTRLWLGHQMDDIAESMLMRLARGSGLAGLAAPRPVHRLADGRTHLRPLLTLAKAEIAASLTAVGMRWREDNSNRGDRFLRNRIRHDVISAWQGASDPRDVLAGAALSRERIEEDESALELWTDSLRINCQSDRLPRLRLRRAPAAVVRRVLTRWLAHHGILPRLSRQAFDAAMLDVISGRRTRHSVGTGVYLTVEPKRIRLIFAEAEKTHPDAGAVN